MTLQHNNIHTLIDNIIQDERRYTEWRGDKLKEYCDNDKNLSFLINLIYSNIIDKNTLEYYMKRGILKFINEHGIIVKNDEDNNTVHLNIIDEILDFINNYIYNCDSEIHDFIRGVIIDINEDNIEFRDSIFSSVEDMVKKGFHNDAKYYVDNLRKYAVNCMYKNQNS